MVALRCLTLGLIVLLHLGTASLAQNPPPAKAKLEWVFEDRKTPALEREMVLATLRGSYAFTITLEQLRVPRLRDFEWIQLDRDTWTDLVINGRTVRVIERHYALFPKRAGQLAIEPVTHSISYIDKQGKRREIEVKSEPVTIEVDPAPTGLGDWWLPAKALEVTDHWSKEASQLRDGENVVRTVTLRALGASAQMIPPQPALRQPWLITFTDPEDRRMELTPLGPLTTVIWRWTLRPITGEPGVLPQVTIPWFDTSKRRSRTEILRAVPFGYAGFGTNTRSQWQARFSGFALAGSALVLGIALPLLLLSPRGRVRSLGEIMAPVRRLFPSPQILALRRAGRQADYHGLRLAARRLSRSAPEAREPRLRAMLFELDKNLFGRGSDKGRPDARKFVRAFEKAAGQRSPDEPI